MSDVLLLVVAALGLFGGLGLLVLDWRIRALARHEVRESFGEHGRKADVLLAGVPLSCGPHLDILFADVDIPPARLQLSSGTVGGPQAGGAIGAHRQHPNTPQHGECVYNQQVGKKKAEAEALGKPAPADEETEVSST